MNPDIFMIHIPLSQLKSPKFLKAAFRFFSILIALIPVFESMAMENPVTDPNIQDSTSQSEYSKKLQKIGENGYLQSLEEFEETRIQGIQRAVMADVKSTIQEARMYMASGVDSVRIDRQIEQIKKQREIVLSGVFEDDSIIQSDRNLGVSRAILNELLESALSLKEKIEIRSDELFKLSFKIDSLSAIKEVYRFSKDSVLAASYASKFVLVGKEIEPTFNMLHNTLNSLDKLLARVDGELILLEASIMEIETKRTELNSVLFSKETFGFMGLGFSDLPFKEVIKISNEKEIIAFSLYFQLYGGRIGLMVILVLMLAYFIHNLKVRANEEGLIEGSDNQHLVVKNPLLSALIIIIGFFQFFFPSPPFVFHFFLWMVAGLALTVLFFRFLSRYWLTFWIVVLLVFFISNSINLILIFTKIERILILFLSIIGVVYGSFLFLNDKRAQLKERRILYFVGYMVFMQTLSLIFNLFGSINLSKALLVSGYLGVVAGIILLWTVRLINQVLALASNMYNKPDKKLFFINFDRIGEKVPGIFYFLLGIGWIILVGRNFYTFHLITSNFNNFLNDPRTLGNYDFTINGLFIFLVILVVSVLLSRIVSFFSSDPDVANSPAQRKHISLGSWLLLVQIFIISMGLFLAFAASGIPLDKITIVLGALGVGIGLGLQGLFNNLVSGVIIAFENPVKVGDLIEINGKPGVMKSIGFRSSVVNMFEGASIIIPNGDLLGQQLVNWTMGKGKKVSIVVGVAYGTDLEKASNLIKEMLMNDGRINKQPVPRVLPLLFGDSRIDLEIAFWVTHYLEVPFVKGDIINKVDVLFKKEGIVIPFPQRDIHFRSSFETQKGDLDEDANTRSPEKD